MQVIKEALKEWAVVIRALEEGKQVVLLRKGGILDQGFDIVSSKFMLFPTFEHQHKDYIRQEFYDLFYNLNTNIINSAASIYKVYETFDKDKLLRLSKYHIYNESFIDYRLNIYKDRPVKVLIVRTYMLEEPLSFSDKAEYKGCKSWVSIDNILKVREEPIISNTAFNDMIREIEMIMNEV